MADSRAMEEQMERHNPVNPKRLLGSGATPSMGLSQFRGGKKGRMRKVESDSDSNSDSDSEAHGMGKALGSHLHGLHGGAFHKAFAKGVLMAGGANEDAQSRRLDAQEALRKKQNERFAQGKKAYDTDNTQSVSDMRKQHNATTKAQYEKENPILSKVGEYGMKGVKGFRDLTIEHGEKIGIPKSVVGLVKATKEVTGEGKTGAYEGKGKKRRSPAGANDGRRKRAEVVKKVMAEKGMKMIEASKYVKEHGLY